MTIEQMRHERKPFARQIVAQIGPFAPLAVDLGIRIDVVRTVDLARVQIQLVGRAVLFAVWMNIGGRCSNGL